MHCRQQAATNAPVVPGRLPSSSKPLDGGRWSSPARNRACDARTLSVVCRAPTTSTRAPSGSAEAAPWSMTAPSSAGVDDADSSSSAPAGNGATQCVYCLAETALAKRVRLQASRSQRTTITQQSNTPKDKRMQHSAARRCMALLQPAKEHQKK